MGYDRGDIFPFNLEPNGIPFGSKSKGKLSPRSYFIQFEKKRKYSFISVSVQFLLRVTLVFFFNVVIILKDYFCNYYDYIIMYY